MAGRAGYDRAKAERPATGLTLGDRSESYDSLQCRTTSATFRVRTIKEQHVPANNVRVPAVPRGEVVVVDRYTDEQPKAVVLNPDDYAYLRETAALVDEAGTLTEPFSTGVFEARGLEDRPRDDELVEDSGRLADLLGL
jgi:hypothetical protein